VFQLEEGEILAEPLPSRDQRNGCLLYEAAEGGAGVLTRLVSEQDAMAQVARAALKIMHFDVEKGLPEEPSALTDLPRSECVAACYKCLMSYYNQPDHELIDRRNDEVRELLLRLARSKTHVVEQSAPTPVAQPTAGGSSAWHAQAQERGIPAPDSKPLVAAGAKVPLVWTQHYVAVSLGDLSTEAITALENLGFDVITFGANTADWSSKFDELAKALGAS
jgi:hypothetical protein